MLCCDMTHLLGHQVDFPTHVGEDVHTVASLLKLYLRELPEPVVDHYNYRKVIDATKGMHMHGDRFCIFNRAMLLT